MLEPSVRHWVLASISFAFHSLLIILLFVAMKFLLLTVSLSNARYMDSGWNTSLEIIVCVLTTCILSYMEPNSDNFLCRWKQSRLAPFSGLVWRHCHTSTWWVHRQDMRFSVCAETVWCFHNNGLWNECIISLLGSVCSSSCLCHKESTMM